MYRISGGFAAAVVAAVMAFSSASTVQARGVAIDGDGGESSWQAQTICTYGQACAGITLGFQVDVGKGLTNQIFVYDNGLISIGSAISPDVDPVAALSDLPGQDIFSPFLSPTDTGLFAPLVPLGPLEYQAVYGVEDPGVGFMSFAAFNLKPFAGSNPGAFTLTFLYGDPAFPVPDFTRGVWGYQFGAVTDGGVNYGEDLSFNFDLGSPADPGAPGVPEPATWAMMILGFGAVGGVLRRRRAGGALA
jgi:hypothetical protein